MLKRMLKSSTNSIYLSAPTDGSLVPAGFPGGPPRLPGAAGRPEGVKSSLMLLICHRSQYTWTCPHRSNRGRFKLLKRWGRNFLRRGGSPLLLRRRGHQLSSRHWNGLWLRLRLLHGGHPPSHLLLLQPENTNNANACIHIIHEILILLLLRHTAKMF